MASFMERFRAGQIPDDQVEDELDNAVDAWHDGVADGDIVHMFDYLGMTYDEFTHWVRQPSAIFDMRSTS